MDTIEMISVSLTLNRWHKVGERLRKAIEESEKLILQAFGGITILAYVGPSQIEGFQKSRTDGMQAKADLVRLLKVRCTIRNTIARHNAASVNELLSEIEANQQRIKLLRQVIRGQHATRVPPERLEHIFSTARQNKGEVTLSFPESKRTGSSDDLFFTEASYPSSGVDVAILTPAEVEEFKSEMESLEKLNFQLHDRLAEQNLTRLTIELPADIATRFGIA